MHHFFFFFWKQIWLFEYFQGTFWDNQKENPLPYWIQLNFKNIYEGHQRHQKIIMKNIFVFNTQGIIVNIYRLDSQGALITNLQNTQQVHNDDYQQLNTADNKISSPNPVSPITSEPINPLFQDSPLDSLLSTNSQNSNNQQSSTKLEIDKIFDVFSDNNEEISDSIFEDYQECSNLFAAAFKPW